MAEELMLYEHNSLYCNVTIYFSWVKPAHIQRQYSTSNNTGQYISINIMKENAGIQFCAA